MDNDLLKYSNRLTEVELLLRRLSVDHNSGRLVLSNVITLPVKDSKVSDKDADKATVATEADLEAIQEKNRKNKERLDKERKAANKQTLRNYYIKG